MAPEAPVEQQRVLIDEVMSPEATYRAIVRGGTVKANMHWARIFILGMAAGCYLGFGGILMYAVGGNIPGIAAANPCLKKLIQGLVFPVGLLLVIINGSELFTGNTMTLTIALLENKISIRGLLKNWFFSYFGNLAGSLLMVFAEDASGCLAGNTMPAATAQAKVSLTWGVALLRGFLANWLVNLAVWHATTSSSLPGKMMGLWPPITAFVAMGFEHSIANMYLIPMGLRMGATYENGTYITVSDFIIRSQIPVTIGNILAGVLPMALVCAGCYGWLGSYLWNPAREGWLQLSDKKKGKENRSESRAQLRLTMSEAELEMQYVTVLDH